MVGFSRQTPRKRNAKANSRRLNRTWARFESLEDRRLLTIFNVTTTIDRLDTANVTLAHPKAADGTLSLREAIYLSNLHTGVTDTVVLKKGTYKITIAGDGEDNDATGDFDILESIIIKNASGAKPVVDGNGFDRVFDVLNPSGPGVVAAEFDGLTIRGGNVEGDGGGVHGLATPSNLTFVDTTITNNQASGSGGGIFNGGGNTNLLRSHVDNNSAQSEGGGIFQGAGYTSLVTLTKSTLNSNSAAEGGGGIRDTAEDGVNFICSQIKNNQAYGGKGGGAFLDTHVLTVDNSIISGNTATDDGGGVNASDAITTMIRNNSTFSDNYSDDIGGGFNGGGDITVTRSSFIHNNARAGGGGLNQDNDGDINISCSTFSKNVSVFEVGGAIWTASSGTFNISDSKFTYNTSGTGSENNGEGGGGAINTAIPITVRRSTFDHNSSATEAGAIGTSADIEVIDCKFTYNKANGGEGGGAISGDDCNVTLTRSLFDNNLAAGSEGDGGGVYVDDGEVTTVTDCTFSRNSSGGAGGGLFVDGETAKISGSTFNDNNAHERGGGMSLQLSGDNDNAYPGDLGPGSSIINCTIGANGTAGLGGGIYFDASGSADLTIINVTIAFNAADQGGGIYHTSDGDLHIGNTIVAKNTATTAGPDVFGGVDDLGSNLVTDTSGSTGFGSVISSDPKLSPLANNGGPTKTYALLRGSPAIDAADSASAPKFDQRGILRGSRPDIGAYEKK